MQTEHRGQVGSVAINANGYVLASGGADIKIWDLRARTRTANSGGPQVAAGHELRKLEGQTDMIRSVAFSPDGRTLVRLYSEAAQFFPTDCEFYIFEESAK